MRESEREREHGVLTVTPAFLVILKVGLEDEDKVGINEKDDASFCSFREKCQNKSWVGQFGDLAIGSSLKKKKEAISKYLEHQTQKISFYHMF